MRNLPALNLCVVAMALATSASAAAVFQSQTRRMPVASETVLHQQQGGLFAAGKQHGTHFLSPDASAPVVPHVMTPQDRQILREQIQSTASGNLPQPQPAPSASSN